MTYHALKTIRVLDLGIITAGRSTSAVLADLGAEVIKVEGPSYTDPFREWSGRGDSATWWNESPPFNATNRNKTSLCLELKSPQGRALFLDLVKHADVVVENFRAGVLDRLQVGFDQLAAVNERIILASISSQGATGPSAAHVSFGSTLEASGGLASLMRYPGETPQITGRAFNYPDQVVSMFAAGAILTALIERRRTGKGAWIDLSQRELTAYLIGEALVAAQDGSVPDPYFAGSAAAIQGIFKSLDGLWIAVTVQPPLAAAAERIGADVTQSSLQAWVQQHPASEVTEALRSAGAAAEIVHAARGGVDPDPLATVNAFGVDSEGRQVKGLPIRLGGQDLRSFRTVSALGQENEAIATGLMGLTPSDYRQFVEAGIFSDAPRKSGAV